MSATTTWEVVYDDLGKPVSIRSVGTHEYAILKHGAFPRPGWQDTKDNARLMAASPDLRDALLAALPLLERSATEEARANLAPRGLAKRTEAAERLAAAKAALAKAAPLPGGR